MSESFGDDPRVKLRSFLILSIFPRKNPPNRLASWCWSSIDGKMVSFVLPIILFVSLTSCFESFSISSILSVSFLVLRSSLLTKLHFSRYIWMSTVNLDFRILRSSFRLSCLAVRSFSVCHLVFGRRMRVLLCTGACLSMIAESWVLYVSTSS